MTTKNPEFQDACDRSRKLTEENKKMMHELSALQQFKESVSQTVRSRKQKKSKSSIYDFLKDLKSPKSDKADLKTLTDLSSELWWKGSFEGGYKPKETIKEPIRIKKHPDGDIGLKDENTVEDPKTKEEQTKPVQETIKDEIEYLKLNNNQTDRLLEQSNNESEKVNDENLKLKASVKSYQALVEKRKEEILSLQESMCYQNREIQRLRQTLQQYQRKATDVRSNVHAMEKEILSLKQVLKAETEKSANLKRTNDSKLEVIDQLSWRLQSEQEKTKRISELERQLKTENENLSNLLNLERETNKNLEKELSCKQSQIDQLLVQLRAGKMQLSEIQKQSQDVSAFIREEHQLKEELTAAKNQMFQLTNKKEHEFIKLQQEKEQLQGQISQQLTDINEKTESLNGLQQQINDLKMKMQTQNIKFNDIAQSLIEKQNQLININTRLEEANSTFGKEKAQIQRALARLESTHKKVLVDLKNLLTNFKKQLVEKYKESENLKKKLMKREEKLLESIQQINSVNRKNLKGDSSSMSNGTVLPNSLKSVKPTRKRSKNVDAHKNIFNRKKKKIKAQSHRSGHSLFSDFAPISYKSSALSLQKVSKSVSKQKYSCEASGYSERGDSSSIDGFESSGTVSTFRRPETPWVPHYHQIRPFKPIENHSDFLRTINLYHMSNLSNLYSTFMNISPALINLGLSHFMSQIDKIQKTNNIYSALLKRNNDLGGNNNKKLTLTDLTQIFRQTNHNSDDKVTATKPTMHLKSLSRSKHDLQTTKTASERLVSLCTHKNDKTFCELLVLLCSNLYKTVSKMVSDN